MATQPTLLGKTGLMKRTSPTPSNLPKRNSLQGLYIITDATLPPEESLLTKVEQAILGGARIVQYRDKSADGQKRLAQAYNLMNLCSQYNIPLIINDDAALAVSVGANGVHLGKNDIPIEQARSLLGDTAIIGVSCYTSINLAVSAETQGADYVAFGSFFPSPTKPNAVRADIELLKQATNQLRLPICAIGGITAKNASALITAGTHMVAVISEVFASPNPEKCARSLARLFSE
jgi:thiamine-phosphate pyrophosphorylase